MDEDERKEKDRKAEAFWSLLTLLFCSGMILIAIVALLLASWLS